MKKWHFCDKCDYKGKTPSAVRKHKLAIHTIRKPVKCELCSKEFPSEQHLQAHTNRVHLKTLKKIKCEQCDHSTTSKQSLKIHVDSVHLGLRPYKCEVCGTSFTQPSHLRTHKKMMHKSSE